MERLAATVWPGSCLSRCAHHGHHASALAPSSESSSSQPQLKGLHRNLAGDSEATIASHRGFLSATAVGSARCIVARPL